MGQSRTQFDLVQDNRRLRLVPLNSPLVGRSSDPLTDESLESMLVQVISAKLDAQIDDLDEWEGG